MTELNKKILTLLNESEGHLNAEEAFLLAKKQNIDVSLASVYRILGKLADDGLINRLSIPGRPDVFDKTISKHAHLVCKCCGKVKDVHIPSLDALLYKESKVEVDGYHLTIDYVCENCKKKNIN